MYIATQHNSTQLNVELYRVAVYRALFSSFCCYLL